MLSGSPPPQSAVSPPLQDAAYSAGLPLDRPLRKEYGRGTIDTTTTDCKSFPWRKGGPVHRSRHSLCLAICVLTCCIVIVAGLSRPPAVPPAAAKTPIKIGVLAPLSGPLAAPGRDIADGARLYVDEVGGEMVGRK